jgi:hypothetical protein
MSTAAPAAITREQLRELGAVALVKPENHGFALEKQPNGVYGFSYAPLQECPVYGQQTFQVFEVHKRTDGSKWVLGHLTPDEIAAYERGELVEVSLYPEAFEQSVQLFALAADQVLKHRTPSRIDGNYIRATIRKP